MESQNKMKRFLATWGLILAGVTLLLWNGGVITTMMGVSESNPMWFINVVCITLIFVPAGVLLIGYGLSNLLGGLYEYECEEDEYEDD